MTFLHPFLHLSKNLLLSRVFNFFYISLKLNNRQYNLWAFCSVKLWRPQKRSSTYVNNKYISNISKGDNTYFYVCWAFFSWIKPFFIFLEQRKSNSYKIAIKALDYTVTYTPNLSCLLQYHYYNLWKILIRY